MQKQDLGLLELANACQRLGEICLPKRVVGITDRNGLPHCYLPGVLPTFVGLLSFPKELVHRGVRHTRIVRCVVAMSEIRLGEPNEGRLGAALPMVFGPLYRDES